MRRRQDGCEEVKDELDQLNKAYMEMVDWANVRLRQISDTLASQGDMQVGWTSLRVLGLSSFASNNKVLDKFGQ